MHSADEGKGQVASWAAERRHFSVSPSSTSRLRASAAPRRLPSEPAEAQIAAVTARAPG
jgi:hypothetical protein